MIIFSAFIVAKVRHFQEKKEKWLQRLQRIFLEKNDQVAILQARQWLYLDIGF
jgi:hypothetical protein